MSLKKLTEQINESTKPGSVIVLDSVEKIDCDVLPTGIAEIDQAFGIGGFPRGRITEIFGDEGTGKTSFCLHAIAQANLSGLSVGFIDAECALNIRRAEAMGVDKSKFMLAQPDNGEEALEIAEIMIRSGKVAMVVIDSVAALTPKVEIEKDMGDATMGSQARLMSQAMRKLVAVTAKQNVALIFTNQIRKTLIMYGTPDTTSGGNALKFYASLRIKLKRIGSLVDQNGGKLASRYKMSIIKNKLMAPFAEVEYCTSDKGIYIFNKKSKLKTSEQIEEE